MNIYNDIKYINEPELIQGQYLIYVLENSDGDIKIGISKHIEDRLRSLTGSNSAGKTITKIAISEPTYLRTIETNAHNHFNPARIEGEWFNGKIITFEDVIFYIDSIFNSDRYPILNSMRKKYSYSKRNKDGLKA